MGKIPIKFKSRHLKIHKSYKSPDLNSKTVLSADTWEYVEMWLKRENEQKALFFWRQSKSFFEATLKLPKTSAPLTAYYCFLNAAKALLIVKKSSFSDDHGVSGDTESGNTSLSNEIVEFKRNGVLGGLCEYMDEGRSNDEYTLKDIFYNLPYIHRSYSLTFSSQPELFIPIHKPKFYRKNGSKESWLSFEIIDKKFTNGHTLNKLPDKYERNEYFDDSYVIRRTNRFRWHTGSDKKENSLRNITNYHRKCRKDIYYIYGKERLWYLKRKANINETIIPRSTITLTFAAMHRLSELSRYDPVKLEKHFDSQHNWLLSEFIETSILQYIDNISSEITGKEFMMPGRKVK